MQNIVDHGLPLVQLKEQRRDLVIALQRRTGSISDWQLQQIAAIQQAISAIEDVVTDIDSEAQPTFTYSEIDTNVVALNFAWSIAEVDL
jgi:hypothetical protein